MKLLGGSIKNMEIVEKKLMEIIESTAESTIVCFCACALACL